MDFKIIFNYETKEIEIFKDCAHCKHVSVCIFHQKFSYLSIENRMCNYLEDNNILHSFDVYSNCAYNYPVGTSPNLQTNIFFIRKIIYDNITHIKKNLLQEKYPEHITNIVFFLDFSNDLKIDVAQDTFHVILKTTNKDIGHGTVVHDKIYKISDILSEWKFI